MKNKPIEPILPVKDKAPDGPPPSGAGSTHAADMAKTVALEGENIEFFQQLVLSLYSELEPASAVENHLVENIAVARWRHMRLWCLEKAAVENELEKSGTEGSPACETAIALQNLARESHWTAYLCRSETLLEQQYRRSLQAFREHRDWRRGQNREIL